jgi:hypothetical protein
MTTATKERHGSESVEGPVYESRGEAMLEAVNRAEIDVAIATARRYPRNFERAEARMRAMVCKTPDVAADCFYVLPPRGGKRIEGPSIRLAEIVAINYGNIRVVTRPPIIGHDSVTVEWAAIDLESNYSTTGSVSTSILYSKKGDKAGQRYEPDQINTTCLATVAKARRNGVYAIVPGTLVKDLWYEARKFSVGGDRPIEAKREMAMAHFRKMGLDDARILAAVGKSAVEQLSDDDLADLRGLATAIKDGDTTIDKAFPPIGPAGKPMGPEDSKSEQLADKLTKKGPDAAPSGQAAPATQTSGQPAAATDAKPPADPKASAEPTAEEKRAIQWSEIVDVQSEKHSVPRDQAEARLKGFCTTIFKAKPEKLNADQMKDLARRVEAGEIHMTGAQKPKR